MDINELPETYEELMAINDQCEVEIESCFAKNKEIVKEIQVAQQAVDSKVAEMDECSRKCVAAKELRNAAYAKAVEIKRLEDLGPA